MDIPEIKPIELSPEEADLRKQMEADFSNGRPYSGKQPLIIAITAHSWRNS
jgi:hypothetical protein